MFLDPEFHQTSTSTNTSNPDWDYTKMFSFNPVTRQLVDYLKDGFVVLLIYGKQIAKPNHSLNNSYPTRLSRQKAGSDDESGSTISNSNNLPDSSGDKQGLVLELMNIRRQKVKLQQRIVSGLDYTNIRRISNRNFENRNWRLMLRKSC